VDTQRGAKGGATLSIARSSLRANLVISQLVLGLGLGPAATRGLHTLGLRQALTAAATVLLRASAATHGLAAFATSVRSARTTLPTLLLRNGHLHPRERPSLLALGPTSRHVTIVPDVVQLDIAGEYNQHNMTPSQEIAKLKQDNRELAELLVQACKALDAEYTKNARMKGKVAKAKALPTAGVLDGIFAQARTEGLPNQSRESRVVRKYV
jgi:hypothetical protein